MFHKIIERENFCYTENELCSCYGDCDSCLKYDDHIKNVLRKIDFEIMEATGYVRK